jgi:hypothetical protein
MPHWEDDDVGSETGFVLAELSCAILSSLTKTKSILSLNCVHMPETRTKVGRVNRYQRTHEPRTYHMHHPGKDGSNLFYLDTQT